MKLEDFLKKNYNYNPEIKDELQTYFDQWKSWYRGNVRSFHNYFIYNGERKVKQKRYTLNMAKQISEDWSDILWSEKCKISFKNEKAQERFNNLIDDLNLYEVINQLIEKSGALGTSGVVVGVYDLVKNEDNMTIETDNAKMRVDIVDLENIYPLSWNNKEITECAFSSVQFKEGKKYVILSVHKLNEKDGKYHIYNHLFLDSNGNLTEITDLQDTESDFNTQSDTKWFSIFKPCLTNNLFNNNPFGIPHFANAIDNLKSCDVAFDEIKNEEIGGRRRTFVRADLLNYDNGTQKLVFDPNDTTVYQLPKGAGKDDLIQDQSSDLRTDKLINNLNTQLNLLGNQCGFGENHYHFDGTNLSTATAVISSNSKLFRRKKKLEIGYESSIYDLVKAICYVSTKFGKENIDSEEIVIQFDDSIIEDKEAESNRAMREVSAGLLSKVEYRMKVFGETKEIAQKAIEKINNEQESIEDLVRNDDEEQSIKSDKNKNEDKKEDKEEKE